MQGHLNDASSAMVVAKRFRWQIISATIQIIFGSIGLVGGALMGFEISRRHELSKAMLESDWAGTILEGYTAPDTSYWALYVFVGQSIASFLFLYGALHWLRCRNKSALIFTIAGIGCYSAVSWWATSRFPGL